MGLDMAQLSGQIREMARAVGDQLTSLDDRIHAARTVLAFEAGDWEYWRDDIQRRDPKHGWLIGRPLEPMDIVVDVPECPRDYVVAASDGSQLDIDRHGIADCWVVNVGRVAIAYGKAPAYRADSIPTLGFKEDELVIHDRHSDKQERNTGHVLGAYRDYFEGLRLFELAQSLPSERARVALQDGTLIRWMLKGFDPWLKNRFLQEHFTYLEEMRKLPCPIASYLSRTRGIEVVGLVQFLHTAGDLEKWRALFLNRSENPYYAVNDHLIFGDILQSGQRSARFESTSEFMINEYPSDFRVQFFYLKVGREIARVEFPAWVGENYPDLIHAVVYDQCRRGMDYPVALQRAHENAVIHAGDRQQLEALIERSLTQERVPLSRSAKAVSKLRPGL